MRVVIADDSQTVRSQIASSLTRAGHDVVGVASDGRDALALCIAHRPDVIVLDISMGEHGGDVAADRIADSESAGAIVVGSSVAAKAEIVYARIRERILAYKLSKPYDRNMLLGMMQRVAIDLEARRG